MTRMTRIFTFLAVCVLLTARSGDVLAEERKPNIVFVLVDNWGWGDIGVQGSTVPTPRIDHLASEGVRFTNYNVESQCTPTRSAIHTGRLPIRSGTHRVTYGMPYGLAPWEYTLPELLSDAGYATAAFGKWHLGDVQGRLPTDQGYDVWWGLKNTTDEASYSSTPQFDAERFPQPYVWEATRGGEAIKAIPLDMESRGSLDREIVERSVAYMRAQAKGKKPFFLYTALTQVHPPFRSSAEFRNKSKAGVYADILMEVDHHVGVILDALEESGIADDTIVILTGDNGAVASLTAGSNGPFRGGFTGYEGGLRTVGMMRWPGRIEPGRVTDEIVASLDWMPTLAALVGESARVPTDRPIDGVDQSDFVLGAERSKREHVLCYIGDELFSVKWRNFKIHMKTIENLMAPIQRYTFPLVYDVRNDPGERVELMSTEKFSYSWVYVPMGEILSAKARSMKEFPNIKPGEDFQGYEAAR